MAFLLNVGEKQVCSRVLFSTGISSAWIKQNHFIHFQVSQQHRKLSKNNHKALNKSF